MDVDKVDIVEVFWKRFPGNFHSLCGLVHGGPFQIRSRWSVSDEIAQRESLEMVRGMRLLFILGSLRSVAFSRLQILVNVSGKYRETLDGGTGHWKLKWFVV